MKRYSLFSVSALLCLLTFFAIHQVVLASSTQETIGSSCPSPSSYAPGESGTGTTPENVEFTETFIGPPEVPLFTPTNWTLRITIVTPIKLTAVNVTERLGAELQVYVNSPSVSHNTSSIDSDIHFKTSGGSSKYTIYWDIETIPANTWVTLELIVHTDVNPGAHQAYTSCGCYPLNSGPILDYNEASGKYSDWGWIWEVYVPCPPAASLFSDALRILPVAIISGVFVVLRRRRM